MPIQGLSSAQRNTSLISSIFIRTEQESLGHLIGPLSIKKIYILLYILYITNILNREQESLSYLVDRVPRSCPIDRDFAQTEGVSLMLAIADSYDRSVVIIR